ncbi:MAG: hypothetical protein KDE59_05635 [Anaerolineales bacterium]|nr:hypothetical protein [Anaerolineales bacterium]
MKNGKFAIPVIVISAIIVTGLAILAGRRLYQGDGSLLRNVTFSTAQISPNADGADDIVVINYEISRNATVSIYFESEAGERHYFRRERQRGADEYEVWFSGVVEGYRLPDETIQGEILARLLQDGQYSWVIEAEDEDGVNETVTGQLSITEADVNLPEMRNFTLDKHVFSPNQDGIDDRVEAQFDLQKEATVRVFLLRPDGVEVPITEKEREVPAGSPGRHYYDYEGGVDNKDTPPPDGTYPIYAVAEDDEGQRIRVSSELTIEFGGVPYADIISPPVGDTVEFNLTSVAVCDTIYFTMTVENYGVTPIRTTGPEPGTIYDSDWNYNTLGWHTESGAWRIAIGFENELSNYPYRWAIGTLEDLEEINGHLYLMPGQRAVVQGGIRVTGPFGERNPQPVWAGLIHEDVEISQFNNRVDPKSVLVDMPDDGNFAPCAERAVPAAD